MAKELSKQLCELCGLPSEKEVIDPKQKQLADHGDPRFSTPSLIKVTLDFTKPENFIRLFNLNGIYLMMNMVLRRRGLLFMYCLIMETAHRIGIPRDLSGF